MCSTRKCLFILSCLLIPVTTSGADFALSIDVPASVTVSSEFDVVLRGTSVNNRLIAYSALLDYDATALSLISDENGFSGTVWEQADYQLVNEEAGGKIRIAAVIELPQSPSGPSSIATGQNLSFLKLRFRADTVRSNVDIGFAGTVDDNLLVDENLIGYDTGNGLELNPASTSVVLNDSREIEVTPLSLDFGDLPAGSSATRQIVVASAGIPNLEILSVQLGSGSSDDFEIVSVPTLPTELASGNSFFVQVRYRPSSVGADSGTLLIESDDSDESIIAVSLAGNGLPPAIPEIDLVPVAVDYGQIFVGASSNRDVRVRNIGTGSLTVTSVELDLAASQNFLLSAVPGLPASVNPGQELVFTVRYLPSSAGSHNGLVVIESDDSDEAVATVSLSGVAVPPVVPEIDVSPLSVDFGSIVVARSDDTVVRIANVGTTSLTISTLGLGGSTSPDFSLSSVPTLPESIAPGGDLQVQVTYSPSGIGPASGTLVIESDDVDESRVSIPLAGEGVATPAPEIDLSSSEIDFGQIEIATSSDVTLRISNQGTLPLDITALQLDSVSSLDLALSGVPSLPHSIAPGGELAILITYSPQEIGTDVGSVVVRSNDDDESFVTVSVSGFGLPEQIQGIAAHLPLNCNVDDLISNETGMAIGSVRCGPDRFLGSQQTIEFIGRGFVSGSKFPVVGGDFVLEAWVRPTAGSERVPAEIFVIHNDQNPQDVPSLVVEWEEDTHLIRVRRLSGESAEFGGLTEDWHHVLLARRNSTLSLYVDGQLKDTMTDTDVLGGAYTLGAAPQNLPFFHGNLDELILENGTLGGDDDVIERTLRGGPSVYVHPTDRARAIFANPGFSVEALKLRLSSQAADLELDELVLVAKDITPEGGETPPLDYLENGRLVLQTECGVEESEIEIADLVVTDIDGGTVRIELRSTTPVRFSNDACFVALFDLNVQAPLDRLIQFSLEELEDLEVVDIEDRIQYLAGERLLGKAALQGDRFRIRTGPPPELTLEFPSAAPAIEETGALGNAEMHVLTLAAGASEGLKLIDLTYRAAEGTSVHGISNIRLFVDLNSNGELDPNEESQAGELDVTCDRVEFSGTGIEIPAGGEIDLVLLADLEFFEAPSEESGAGAFLLPTPLSGPGLFPRVPLMILAGGVLAFLLVGRGRYRPKLAGAVALVAVSCIFGFGAGCSGGGGGGGGPPRNPSQSFQLVIESAEDIRVEGIQSETEPALVDFPAAGIPGALYVIAPLP